MTRTTGYIDNPPFDGDVQSPPSDPNEWTDVLNPGDLLVARSEGGLASTLIMKTDGFFTHTAVYLGADEDGLGWLAHAYLMGVQLWDLNRLREKYPSGIGWARPGYGPQLNAEAAAWAKKHARSPDVDDLVPYGYENLGLCFAVVTRAMWRRRRDSVEAIDESDIEELFEAADRAFEGRSAEDLETSSCSAYAWRAYHEGADRAIVPELLEGVRVEDGLLKKDADSALARSAEMAALKRLSGKWNTLSLMLSALPGAAALFDTDKGALLSEIVTPGDLWCSPSMVARGRLL